MKLKYVDMEMIGIIVLNISACAINLYFGLKSSVPFSDLLSAFSAGMSLGCCLWGFVIARDSYRTKRQTERLKRLERIYKRRAEKRYQEFLTVGEIPNIVKENCND